MNKIKINEIHFTSNSDFNQKIKDLTNNKMYSSAKIGFLYKNYLIAIDTNLYLFNSSFDYHVINFLDISIDNNKIYSKNYKADVELRKFDFNLNYPLNLHNGEANQLINYLNSLNTFINDTKTKLPLAWINNQHIKVYYLAYYKKYEEQLNYYFLKLHSWLTFKNETLDNPLIILANNDTLFFKWNVYFPKDLMNFKKIITNKLKTSESDLIINGLIIYGLRQVALEFNNNYFNENFPELISLNTTDITKLLLTLHNNLLWKNELNRFLFYYLHKNHLLNKLNSNQLEDIFTSIVETNRNIEFDYETMILENELTFENDINNDSTSPHVYTLTDIDLMNGIEFEEFCGLLFEKLGYSVEITPSSRDQGIDLIAYKSPQTLGVQAKRYSKKVTNSAIQEVVAGINHYKIQKGLVITNNYFTDSAIELAASNNVVLWDRDILELKLKEIFY